MVVVLLKVTGIGGHAQTKKAGRAAGGVYGLIT
jgi:hypothetical protein